MASKKSKKGKRPRGRARRRRRRRIHPLYVLIPVALVVLVGGGWLLANNTSSSPGTSESPQFPVWLRVLGPKVKRAYAQAVAHRDELQYIPCYCGCENMGHTAVVDCHIASVATDGSITYERHASA